MLTTNVERVKSVWPNVEAAPKLNVYWVGYYLQYAVFPFFVTDKNLRTINLDNIVDRLFL